MKRRDVCTVRLLASVRRRSNASCGSRTIFLTLRALYEFEADTVAHSRETAISYPTVDPGTSTRAAGRSSIRMMCQTRP